MKKFIKIYIAIFLGGYFIFVLVNNIIPSSIDGRYDLVVQQKDEYIFGDALRELNAYFEINKDRTIKLHSEGNLGLVNRSGTYTYDPNSQTISIKWNDYTQQPSLIRLERNGASYKFYFSDSEYSQSGVDQTETGHIVSLGTGVIALILLYLLIKNKKKDVTEQKKLSKSKIYLLLSSSVVVIIVALYFIFRSNGSNANIDNSNPSIQHISSDSENNNTYNPDLSKYVGTWYIVKNEKSYFYDDENYYNKRDFYVMKGDKIFVENINNDKSWVFGKYTGLNGEETRGWLLMSSLVGPVNSEPDATSSSQPIQNNNSRGDYDDSLSIPSGKVDVLPSFPGGDSAWEQYNNEHFNLKKFYGIPAKEYKIVVQFLVDSIGNIKNIKSISNNGYGMEEEVVKMIKYYPKWIPAQLNGKSVNYLYTQTMTIDP